MLQEYVQTITQTEKDIDYVKYQNWGLLFVGTWSVTTLVLSYLSPNQLASQVLSPPGSAIVFLWEYFTDTIPSEIANIALHNAESYLIDIVNYQIQSGMFAIPILPPDVE